MKERKGSVTMGGNPVTLLGPEIRVGDKAPSFSAVTTDLKVETIALADGKVRILSSVPSLDTSVCDTETRRFNAEASTLGPDVEILTISMDLPFAQKRWCGAAGIDRVRTVSDHREASFGLAYGTLIKDLRLLARAVFVVDRKGVVRHVEYVKEIGTEPNYDAALAAVRALTRS
mgnify:CR=1 FL=1